MSARGGSVHETDCHVTHGVNRKTIFAVSK
jgi:hypothetical protein